MFSPIMWSALVLLGSHAPDSHFRHHRQFLDRTRTLRIAVSMHGFIQVVVTCSHDWAVVLCLLRRANTGRGIFGQGRRRAVRNIVYSLLR